MSELINAQNNTRKFHWQLLTTVSTLALLAAVYGSSESRADDQDADRRTVWIELGGQAEHVSGQGDPFAPGFLSANPNSPVLQSTTPQQAQNPPPFSFGVEGKISFQPEGSDWVFSASVLYGRSNSSRHIQHQTHRLFSEHPVPSTSGLITTAAKFADTKTSRQESHAVLDFLVGKDVGLGLFGNESSSVLSFGVRFAQLVSSATFDIHARPDLRVSYGDYFGHEFPHLYFHTYAATGQASRSFHGIGPSLSWNGSAPLLGERQGGELTFDWGANAALLFGRQRTRVQHQESGHYQNAKYLTGFHKPYVTVYQRSGGHNGARSVIVPNAGGFAGASYRIENFKVSFGYRADFFFGAIDGGIDTRKSETLGFYGPFASVSVGLGG